MNPILRQFLHGLTGGIMASGTAALTVLQKIPLLEVTPGQWAVIGIGGLLAAVGQWQSLLAPSPVKKT